MLFRSVSVFYSIVDRMYIGNIPKIGEVALAGVGICGPIVTLVSSFAILVGVGGAPLMSIRLGQKNEKGAEQILANCFLMLTVMALVLTVFVLGMREKLLWWFRRQLRADARQLPSRESVRAERAEEGDDMGSRSVVVWGIR